MSQRMKNPAGVLPDATSAIQALVKAVYGSGVPSETMGLVHLRASQINGCSSCVVSGALGAKAGRESDERLAAVATWREAPWYSEGERAAPALAEALTRLSDPPDPVPDDVWAEAERHFDEDQLAGLVLWVTTSNLFNRINVTTRQPAGGTWVEELQDFE